MAQLIPKIALNSITPQSELKVARALVESLPTDTRVYHSYPWLRPERSDRNRTAPLREGEAFAALVDPRYGLLVLEVKGGIIDYDSETHLWYRRSQHNPREEITQPFKQAQRNMRALKNMIKPPPGGVHSFTFGYAVVFPDCDPSGAPPPGAIRQLYLAPKISVPSIGM